jgi:phage terminase small subunit
MPGAKGRSGGARSGAGRPRKEPPKPVPLADRDMLQLLQDIALGRVDATPMQVKAAVAAVQYTHAKKGESGKKAEKEANAKAAASKFSRLPPPRVVVNNRN